MRHVERKGIHFRVCDPSWKDPLDTSFSKGRGGRWNAPGAFGVLYLNATIFVAAGNARRAYDGEIATLFDLRPEHRPDLQVVVVDPIQVIDAVSDLGLRALRLPTGYPVGVPWSRCRRIGARAHAAGERGIACRSADVLDRSDLVVEGEELALFDTALRHVSRVVRVPFAKWYPAETGADPPWARGRR